MSDPVQRVDYGKRGAILIYPDAASLAEAAAATFVRVTTDAVSKHGRAFVALSGGTTPRQMGELLKTEPYRDQVPWGQIDVFWGDERWVPEESPDSNAGVARRTFLDDVPIPADQIHPFPTKGLEPAAAAEAYARTMREVIGAGDTVPRFDLVLLGMGDDGHTASLFPGTTEGRKGPALAVAHYVPKLDATRLTLAAPVLNAGREVVFLVSGQGKAPTLAAVLEGPERADEFPSQLIRPVDGQLVWLVDRAAASQLSALGSAGG
jgi:6-phosphogluconolactonase